MSDDSGQKKFIDNVVTEDKKGFWELASDEWSNQARDPKNYFTKRTGLVTQLICRHMQKGSALDVGCGSGIQSYQLAQKGFDVFGMDLSEKMVAESSQRLSALVSKPQERFRVCRNGDIPFEGLKFDLITAIDVLPYIADWPQFIDKLSTLLNPDGMIALSCTVRRGLFVAEAMLIHSLRLPFYLRSIKVWKDVFANLATTGFWSGGFVDYHTAKQCYTASCLDVLLESKGFKMIEEINLYNISILDKDPLTRGQASQKLARSLSWNHIGLYRGIHE